MKHQQHVDSVKVAEFGPEAYSNWC